MGSTIRNQITTSEQSQEEEEAYLFATHLTTAGNLAMVLKSAVELDIFEIMARAGPGAYTSASQLAAQLQTKNPDAPFMLDRILCLLAAHSVLKCTVLDLPDGKVERRYGLAPVCKFLTKDANGYSLAPLLLMNHDKVVMESWYHLKDAVVEGGVAFNKAYGMPVYKYFNGDPRFSKVFNQGLSNHSAMAMNKLLEVYQGFEGVETLVDVGGGIGAELNVIISKYPSIKGINFDLPHVVRDAPPYPGIEHVGGDMFVSVPKGDAIFMKHTCHNWSDELCSKALKNCYDALPNNGKVIVAESIMPVVPDTGLASQNVIDTDVIMLANTTGGKERTEKEFEALAKAAGFHGFRVVRSGSNPCVMEFLKKI